MQTNNIFGIVRNFRVRKIISHAKKHLFENWPLFDLALTWPSPKVKLGDAMGSNFRHYRYLRAKWPSKHASHGILVTFVFNDLLWPDVDFEFFKYDLDNHALPFLATYHHFEWVWVLWSTSYRPESPECENAAFWHFTWTWPDMWT